MDRQGNWVEFNVSQRHVSQRIDTLLTALLSPTFTPELLHFPLQIHRGEKQQDD